MLSQCGDGGESESQRRRFENEQRALVERLETSWRKKTEQLREERTLVEESLDKERVNCEQLERRFKQQEETVRELGSEVERLSGLRQLEDEVGLLNGKLQAARQIRQVRYVCVLLLFFLFCLFLVFVCPFIQLFYSRLNNDGMQGS